MNARSDEDSSRRTLSLTPASDIRTRRQSWLWQDYVPLGTLTLFAGKGGEFKSTFSLHLAAETINGSLPGDLLGSRSPVLLVAYEDAWDTVTVPRLIAAGADLPNVLKVTVNYKTDAKTGEAVPDFPADLPLIERAIVESKARLLIIDPITSTMQGDQHKVADVRAVLDPLAQLAQRHDIAIIGIMHFNKGRGDTSNMLSGSHAFRDVARSVLHFATDPDTGSSIISVDKSSYSATMGESLAFTVATVEVPTDDGQSTSVAKIDAITDSSISVSDIVNRDPDQSDAVTWLSGFLQDLGGSAPVTDVKNAAVADGLAWRTVERARARSGVVTTRNGFGGGSTWTTNVVDSVIPAVPAMRGGGANGGNENVGARKRTVKIRRASTREGSADTGGEGR